MASYAIGLIYVVGICMSLRYKRNDIVVSVIFVTAITEEVFSGKKQHVVHGSRMVKSYMCKTLLDNPYNTLNIDVKTDVSVLVGRSMGKISIKKLKKGDIYCFIGGIIKHETYQVHIDREVDTDFSCITKLMVDAEMHMNYKSLLKVNYKYILNYFKYNKAIFIDFSNTKIK